MKQSINIFKNETDYINHTIHVLESTINSILSRKDICVIAVSGGTSPIPLFKKLSELNVEHDKIVFTLVDERIVDNSNNDSNANLIETYILRSSGKFENTRFYKLFDSALYSENNFSQQDLLNDLQNNIPQADIVMLGMGEDGHFASIFPKITNYEDAIAITTNKRFLITKPLDAKYTRVTMTLAEILKSQYIFLSIKGSKKKEILDNAKKQIDDNLPISRLLDSRSLSILITE